MDHPPDRIEGSRVILRKIEPADAAAIFRASSDLEVVRFMDWPRSERLDDVAQHLSSAQTRWTEGQEYQWAILNRESGAVVGTIATRPREYFADFGYFLARDAWGNGFATDAARVVVNWLRTQPEIFRIGATTDAGNHRSMRVLEAVGLRKEGVLREATVRPNIGPERRDTVFFSWLRPDESKGSGT